MPRYLIGNTTALWTSQNCGHVNTIQLGTIWQNRMLWNLTTPGITSLKILCHSKYYVILDTTPLYISRRSMYSRYHIALDIISF